MKEIRSCVLGIETSSGLKLGAFGKGDVSVDERRGVLEENLRKVCDLWMLKET